MILDTSVLVAIALQEAEREVFLEKINAADIVGVAAPTLVEAGIVLSPRLGRNATPLITQMLVDSDVTVIEFGARHWREAVMAWWRFGRTRHPARLNFGDCMAYATALLAGQPLLARGDGFPQTDIELA